MPKEQPDENPYSDIDELNEAMDFPESKPESNVIPLHNKKLTPEQEEAATIELNKITKQISDIEEEKKILEEAWGEGLARMDKRDKNYKQLKKLLDEFNAEHKNLVSARRVSEIALLTPTEFNELDEVRAKLGKMSSKTDEEQVTEFLNKEETALVPQPAREVAKHKDWGAWRKDKDFELVMFDEVLGVFVHDVINWTHRKIKRLMGKGAELDGEKEEKDYHREKNHREDMDMLESIKKGESENEEQEKIDWSFGRKFRLKKDFDSHISGFKKGKIVTADNMSGMNADHLNFKESNGEWSSTIHKRDFHKYLEPLSEPSEEKGGSKTFIDLAGSEVKSTGELEEYGLSVGTKYRLIDDRFSKGAFPNLTTSEIVEIVGFAKNSDALVQVNGGKVMVLAPSLIPECFNKVSETPEEKGEPKTFFDIDGKRIAVTGEQEKYGLRVGQQVRLRPVFKDNNKIKIKINVTAANHLEIVGFTEKGRVVVQLDGRLVVDDEISKHNKYYEPIPEPPRKKEHYDLYIGGHYLLKEEYKKIFVQALREAKGVVISDFTEDGKVKFHPEGSSTIYTFDEETFREAFY